MLECIQILKINLKLFGGIINEIYFHTIIRSFNIFSQCYHTHKAINSHNMIKSILYFSFYKFYSKRQESGRMCIVVVTYIFEVLFLLESDAKIL